MPKLDKMRNSKRFKTIFETTKIRRYPSFERIVNVNEPLQKIDYEEAMISE